jgi:hypothetical protein
MRSAAAVTLAMVLWTAAAHAQRPQAVIVPDTITVGDVFHAAIRVDLPQGARLVVPDSLVPGEDLESAGRREIRFDTVGHHATVVYPLTAWRPGDYQLPEVTLQVVSDGAVTDLTAALPGFTVRSVLPPDTAGVEPRPAKDVLGANRLWWPILLALIVAAVIATALYLWWRRRRRQPEPVVFTPSAPPRDTALAQLAALARDGLIERGDYRTYYERLTAIMRHYAEAVQPRWSVDLTTSELATRLRGDVETVRALGLIRILGTGDLVKFARATTTADSALHDLDAARAWIDTMTPAPAPADPGEQRAA